MPARRTMADAVRLFAGVPDQCWYLPPGCGSPHGNGYYTITVSGERWLAHRLAYTLLVGAIPADLTLDHLCHTRDLACPGGCSCPHRACVNPAHLEPVPLGTNILRGRSAPADNARRETCPEGHALVQKGSDPTRRHCPVCRLSGRIAKGETSGNGHLRERTRCPDGHLYDEANTYLHLKPDGSLCCRQCRACMRDKERRKYAGPQVTCPVCHNGIGLMRGGLRLQRHYAAGIRAWCPGSGALAVVSAA